jgi:hypothetical protein
MAQETELLYVVSGDLYLDLRSDHGLDRLPAERQFPKLLGTEPL